VLTTATTFERNKNGLPHLKLAKGIANWRGGKQPLAWQCMLEGKEKAYAVKTR